MDVLVSIPPSPPAGTPGADALAGRPGTGLPRLLSRRLLAWLGPCPDPPPHRGVRGLHRVPGIQHRGGRGSPRGQWPPPCPVVAWEPRCRECRGPGDKVPFQPKPWKDLCVCAEVNALGSGERRGESAGWLHPCREPAPHVCLCVCLRVPLCAGGLCISVSVYLCTSCVCLTHHCVFLSLFLGLSPTPAMDL